MIKKVTIIGAGNVATHLAKSLAENEITIVQIFSQHIENAKTLAQPFHAKAISNLSELTNDADFYIICVKDDAIENVLKNFPFKEKLIAHTSGSIGMETFKDYGFTNYGIFYPLQTFSKNKTVKIDEVPFCIESVNEQIHQELFSVAKQLSKNVYSINSEERKTLHLAAVFACNFTNYMYTIANSITEQNNIDFNILKPLIIETANKIIENSPHVMQTGPAKRNDHEVIKNQVKMLADNKDYQEIYKIITNSIIKNNGQL